MAQMREWWANVYPHVEGHMKIGGKFPSLAGCEHSQASGARYRIHVRPKPHGAPKRYRNDHERWIWEKYIAAGSLTP